MRPWTGLMPPSTTFSPSLPPSFTSKLHRQREQSFRLISKWYTHKGWLILDSGQRASCQFSWASLLCITPPERYYHLRFFNLPDLLKPGRNRLPKESCWGITDLCIFVSHNNLRTNSVIRVQGYCAYILFFSFSKLF